MLLSILVFIGVVNEVLESEGFPVGRTVVVDIWVCPELVFVVLEGFVVDDGNADCGVVKYICVVVGECVVEYDDTVLVCTSGGDAVDVVVAAPVVVWVVVTGVSICSLHIIMNSWSYVP